MKLKSNYVKKNVTTICVGGIDFFSHVIIAHAEKVIFVGSQTWL
jgi:hypothetical protein